MADIATLTVRITAALGDFQQSLDRLETSSKKAFDSLSGSSLAANVALGTLAAQGLTAVASKLTGMVTDILEFSDSMVTLEARTGISTDALQELAFVADQTSVPFENLTRASELLSAGIATGSEDLGRALDAMNLSFSDLKGLKPEEQLAKVFEQINKFGTAGEKVAVLNAAFGKMGASLLPAVGQMGKLVEQARALGLVISPETIAAVEEFGDQWGAFSLVVRAELAKELPALIANLKELVAIVTWFRENMGAWNQLNQDAANANLHLARSAVSLVGTYAQLAEIFPGMKTFLGVLGHSTDDYRQKLFQLDVAIQNIGKGIKQTATLPFKITPKPELVLDPNKLKVPKKDKDKALKLIEDDFSIYLRNTQPFGFLFNLYPNRIAIDRTLLQSAALGAAVELQKEIEEIVTEHLKKQGFPPIFLPPPKIEMAPADLTGINKYFDDIAKEAAEHAREAFGAQIGNAIGQGLAQAIEGATLPDVGRTIGAGIGGAIGEQVGKQLGAAIGGVIGGIVGSIAGPVGAAFGALMGQAIGEALSRGAAAKEFATLKKEVFAAAGGFEALEQAAIASARALSELALAERSGNEEQLRRHMANLAEELQHLEFRANKVTDALSKIGQQGGVVSRDLLQQMREIRDFPGAAPKLFQFFKDQTNQAAKGLETFVTNASISSQAAATAATGAIGAIFADLQLQGASAAQAIAVLMPSIDALRTQFEKGKFAGGEAFGQLSTMAAFAADTVAGPLFTAIGGLGDLMAGLFNTGVLTQDMFSGLAGQVTDTWHELVNMGKGGAAGMALIQKPLQRVWELTKDHGFAVDEATQALLDEAEAAGLVGDKFRSSEDKMMIAINTLIDRIGALVDMLAETMVSGAESGAKKVQDALDGIETPTITIPIHFDMDDPPDLPTFSPDSVQGGALTVNAQVNLDGEVLARSVGRNMGRVLAPYGV